MEKPEDRSQKRDVFQTKSGNRAHYRFVPKAGSTTRLGVDIGWEQFPPSAAELAEFSGAVQTAVKQYTRRQTVITKNITGSATERQEFLRELLTNG